MSQTVKTSEVEVWIRSPEEVRLQTLTEQRDSDWADVVSCGRAFRIRGPATGKARLPTVESLTEGTDRRLVPAERSARRPGRSATGTRGPRYRGALPCRALYVSTAILYSMRCGTRSQ